MDLSRLSESDLQAVAAGDLSKVSASGLAYLSGQEETAPESTGSYAGDVVSNVWPSAKRFAGGIKDAVLHPLDTARGVVDLGAGALQNALPEALVQTVGEEPESRKVADQFGQNLTQRYGGASNIAETFRTDPVGVAADVSLLLTGGASGARAVSMPRTAKALNTAAQVTNPVNVVNNPVVKAGVSKVAELPTRIIGDMFTGAGAGALQTAYDATKQGGAAAKDYWDNLRGGVPPDEVIAKAQEGVANLRKTMTDQYRILKNDPTGNKMGWADDKTPLSFNGVAQAYTDALDKYSYKGVTKPGVAPVAADVKAVLDEWYTKAQTDPAFLSIEGLDALKQHLNSIYPTDVANRTGRSFASEVVEGVKKTISAQAPTYRKSLHEYWNKASELDDITRELSLGPTANTGTTLRKLQAIMRGNAGAGWEYRKSLSNKLANAGADVGPALSGQALGSWTPRGLAKYTDPAILLGLGAGTGAWAPAVAGLPFASPRVMGEVYGGLGTVARGVNKSKQAVVNATQPQRLPSISGGLNAIRSIEELSQEEQ